MRRAASRADRAARPAAWWRRTISTFRRRSSTRINIPGFSVAPGTATNSYWDTQTTGQDTSAGGSPMTSAQLSSGLPPGFDPAVWRSASGNYPFLTGQPDPLPVPGEPVPRNSPPACTTSQGPGCPQPQPRPEVGQHRAAVTGERRRKPGQPDSAGSAEGAGSDQHAKQRRNRQRLRRLGRLRQGQCRWKRRRARRPISCRRPASARCRAACRR